MNTKDKTLEQFSSELASSAPAPGGGGAAALAGALAASLASMAANLTVGKKKYADVEALMVSSVERCACLRLKLLGLADRDEECFLPLAEVYSLPKDSPGYEERRREAVLTAASAPFEMLKTAAETAELINGLADKVSRLMVSDAGCAASLCVSAAECAAMNVLVNTRLLPGDEEAEAIKADTLELLSLCRKNAGSAVNAVFEYLNKE